MKKPLSLLNEKRSRNWFRLTEAEKSIKRSNCKIKYKKTVQYIHTTILCAFTGYAQRGNQPLKRKSTFGLKTVKILTFFFP